MGQQTLLRRKTDTEPKGEGWRKPVFITIEVRFEEDNRRVTAADLDRAAEAAMAAAKTSLENRSPAYSIRRITAEVRYLYEQAVSKIKG